MRWISVFIAAILVSSIVCAESKKRKPAQISDDFVLTVSIGEKTSRFVTRKVSGKVHKVRLKNSEGLELEAGLSDENYIYIQGKVQDLGMPRSEGASCSRSEIVLEQSAEAGIQKWKACVEDRSELSKKLRELANTLMSAF